MKKTAFTMSELIVSIGIIGIIAAITAPMLGSIIPDKNKISVLKYNQVISTISNDLVNDRTLYTDEGGRGLNSRVKPTNSQYRDDRFEGNTKYGSLLAEMLQITTDEPDTDGYRVKFNTLDGVEWTIEYVAGGYHTVSLDLNGSSRGNNCSFGQEGCQKPDTFVFKVNQYGKVSGHDGLTRAYLANPKNINDKKKDYETAKGIVKGDSGKTD